MPQLVVRDEIVADAIIPGYPIRRSKRPVESMQPAQERQTEYPPAALPELFVNVTLLTAESSQAWIEPGPGFFPAGEHAESLHRNLKRRRARIGAARIVIPLAQHARGPLRAPMGVQRLEIVVEHRPLPEIFRVRLRPGKKK